MNIELIGYIPVSSIDSLFHFIGKFPSEQFSNINERFSLVERNLVNRDDTIQKFEGEGEADI